MSKPPLSIALTGDSMLSRTISVFNEEPYLHLREIGKQLARNLPKRWERRAARAEEKTRTLWTGGTMFEELGF